MHVADVMTFAVVTTRPWTQVKDALRELSDREITAMPVIDHENHLVGIVSEADLLREGVISDPRSVMRDGQPVKKPVRNARTVGDVMSRIVFTASRNQDVGTVVNTMLKHNIHSVPVVRGERVVGVLSRSDVVRALARADEWIAADVTAKLRDAGLVGWECDVDDGHVRLAGGAPFDTRLAMSLARCVTGVRSVVAEQPAALA